MQDKDTIPTQWSWTPPPSDHPCICIHGPRKLYTNTHLRYMYIGLGEDEYPIEMYRHDDTGLIVQQIVCADAVHMPAFLTILRHVKAVMRELVQLKHGQFEGDTPIDASSPFLSSAILALMAWHSYALTASRNRFPMGAIVDAINASYHAIHSAHN